MLEVIKYLNEKNASGLSVSESLEQLKEDYGIKNSHNEDYPDLYVLNYCQISSPKFREIVKECRSLVLGIPTDELGWHVVSRSYDRFFNLGETECIYDMNYMEGVTKLDGSLIGMFYYKGKWLYRTKSMIMPDNYLNDTRDKWADLIDPLITLDYIDDYYDHTYIFELTSDRNRIVTLYDCTELTLLSMRSNLTGNYLPSNKVRSMAHLYDWRIPERLTFKTMDECVDYVNSLTDLKEGLVLYGNDNRPMAKVKSQAYMRAHAARGELGLTFKRIFDITEANEQDEYIAIFPEEKYMFDLYFDGFNNLLKDIDLEFNEYNVEGISKKEFAVSIGKCNFRSIIMTMFVHGVDASEALGRLLKPNYYKYIREYYDKEREKTKIPA